MNTTFRTAVIRILTRRSPGDSDGYVDLQSQSYTHLYASEQTAKSYFHSINGKRERLSLPQPNPFKVRQCRCPGQRFNARQFREKLRRHI